MVVQYTPEERAAVADALAAKGAALLDEMGPPDWHTMIRTDTLKMWSPYSCVLGQLYDPYNGYGSGGWGYGWEVDDDRNPRRHHSGFRIGLTELFGDQRYDDLQGETRAAVNGFSLPEFQVRHGLTFEDLNDAWLRLLARRAAG